MEPRYTTMKRARDVCPKRPVHYNADGVRVVCAEPIEPFRQWARRVYGEHPPNALSPKLRRVIHGPRA